MTKTREKRRRGGDVLGAVGGRRCSACLSAHSGDCWRGKAAAGAAGAGFVGGLVHYRGDVLTTVSLRHLLDMPPKEGSQDILVLESGGGCFGLLVDSVGEVLTVSSNEFEANPSILDERRRALFAGAYKLKDSLLVMLDPERLDPMRLNAAA